MNEAIPGQLLPPFFKIVRAGNWWLYKIPPLLAIAYAAILLENITPQRALLSLLALLVSLFFVAGYGHVVNDIYDVESDLRAGKENQMAALSPAYRLWIAGALAGIGFIPCLWMGWSLKSDLLLAIIYVLSTLYSAPPLRLKERNIWGVIADASAAHFIPTLLVFTIFYPASSVSDGLAFGLVAAVWAFLAGIRGIVLHQIWDYENDHTAGVTTWVTQVGIEVSRFWLSYVTFPCEVLAFGLLVFVISQFAPLLGGLVIFYAVLKIANFKSQNSRFLNPVPLQKDCVLAHDLYEVWFPLALIVLLSLQNPVFVVLMPLQGMLFYPSIAQRFSELKSLFSIFSQRRPASAIGNQSPPLEDFSIAPTTPDTALQEAQLQAAEAEIQQLQSQSQQTQNQLQDAHNQVAGLQVQCREQQSVIEDLRQQVQNTQHKLEQQLEQLQETLPRQQAEQALLEARLKDAQAQLEQSQRQMEQRAELQLFRQNRLLTLQNKLEQSQEQSQQLLQGLESLKQERYRDRLAQLIQARL
jgi:4-hydroxybenzoate polyprenyltransferase